MKTSRLVLSATALVGVIIFVLVMLRQGELYAPLYTPSVDKPQPAALNEPCVDKIFEDVRYIVCTVDQAKHRVALHIKDQNGAPWKQLQRFAEAQKPLFAMNAGMYHDDLSPVGLYIENGVPLAPLNLNDGAGNFFMKPNGVFGVYANGTPFVMNSDDFAKANMTVTFATQSGPMLVIDGEIHPRFEPDGSSRNIRNGVGIDDEGRAVFAISRDLVSFGKFARLFRNDLKCKNALYFDGVVSAFAQGDSIVQGGAYPAGPIVAVFEAATPVTQ